MNPRGETTLRGTKIVNLRACMALAAGENGFAFSLGSHASELLLWEQQPEELLRTLMRLCLRVPVSSRELENPQPKQQPRIVNQSLD